MVHVPSVDGDDLTAPIRVLIADDDERNRESLTEIVERSDALELAGVVLPARPGDGASW